MGDVLHLPRRARRADPLAEAMALISARLFYLSRDLKCLAAHARSPDEALVVANWMAELAGELGEDAIGQDLKGGG